MAGMQSMQAVGAPGVRAESERDDAGRGVVRVHGLRKLESTAQGVEWGDRDEEQAEFWKVGKVWGGEDRSEGGVRLFESSPEEASNDEARGWFKI